MDRRQRENRRLIKGLADDVSFGKVLASSLLHAPAWRVAAWLTSVLAVGVYTAGWAMDKPVAQIMAGLTFGVMFVVLAHDDWDESA